MHHSIKFVIVLSCLLVFISGCGSNGNDMVPSPAWQGAKQLGSSSGDRGNRVVVDNLGNVYVVGSTNGGLDGNISAGSSDMFLVKYSPSGTKQWTRQLGGSGFDTGNGVAIDANGNIYVTGNTYGGIDGNTKATPNDIADIFLVKYDTSGVKQWTREFGKFSSVYGNSIGVDGTGNIYVAGAADISYTATNIILLKYDNTGTLQWTKQQMTTGNEYVSELTVDNSGNVYLTGSTSGGLEGNINAGNQDVFLIKYDPSGTKQWTRQMGSSFAEYGFGVTVDNSGNIYVAGTTSGELDGNTNFGAVFTPDIFLVKYDPTGVKQWTKQVGIRYSSYDFGQGIAVDRNGNIYVAGYTYAGTDANKTSSGLYISNTILVKFDSTGTKQFTNEMASSANNYGNGIAVDSNGNIYFTGYTFCGLDGNINAGYSDMFLIKYNASGVKQ